MLKKNIKMFDIIIFGAKGDLTQRKLIPALYQLEKFNKINQNNKIILSGRNLPKKKEFFIIIKNSLKKFLKEKLNNKIWKNLKSKIFFCEIDINKKLNFLKLLKILKNNPKKDIINYFATPPNTYKKICKGLNYIKFNQKNSRIIIEKPIGNSYKTSNKIHKKIKKFFLEKQIFRIDHYLGKETIINLITLRFFNPLFFNIWNNKTIEHIQITLSEKIGIENRWNYFSSIGQTKDMVQNHLLQIITLIAMNTPKKFTKKYITQEKIKILKSLRKINIKNIHNVIKGQYKKNFNNILKTSIDKNIKNNQNKTIETFVAIKINIDNKNWKGVPFYIRTGKKLKKKKSEIIIFFKNFNNKKKKKNFIKFKNKLHIKIEPNEGINLHFLNKIPDLEKNNLHKECKLKFKYEKNFKNKKISEPYAKLILEVLKNEKLFFISQKEIKYSWKWIDSIIKAWKIKNSKIEFYKPGSWGPKSSKKLLKKKGFKWF